MSSKSVFQRATSKLASRFSDIRAALTCPRLEIDLMLDKTAGNDAFYAKVVRDYYAGASGLHPKLPIIPCFRYGIAVNVLPATFDGYLKTIERTARQNINKAVRGGYVVGRINYNEYLADIAEINHSTPVRQGPMPGEFLQSTPQPIEDPPSRTNFHDYVYYGVLKDGKLYAYAGCLYAGEAMIITIIYGHAGHTKDGIVPLLLSGMAADAFQRYPVARYFLYDKFFGGSDTFRRFKRKFRFEPHTVSWKL